MIYDKFKISSELSATALGESYFGNALYVALDIPCVTLEDKEVLLRWLNGSFSTDDRFRLQEISIGIYEDAQKMKTYKLKSI